MPVQGLYLDAVTRQRLETLSREMQRSMSAVVRLLLRAVEVPDAIDLRPRPGWERGAAQKARRAKEAKNGQKKS